ncbi:LOW PSII ACCUMULATION-like protein [Wolffia australiana]
MAVGVDRFSMAGNSCIVSCSSRGFQIECVVIGRGKRFSSSSMPPPLLRGTGIRLLSSTLSTRKLRRKIARITCFASNQPSPSDISSTAKIRSEVLSPFRSVRMFFYLAFIASASLGGLIALTQLTGALANASRSAEIPDILYGLGIDVGAVAIFAFLYTRDRNAQKAQVARLSREESLSNLKLRVDENRVISVNSLRGIARLVIISGPASFISECFKGSLPFSEGLLERGVLIVACPNDGNSLDLSFDEGGQEDLALARRRKRLWQLTPVFASEWSKWLDDQKKMAKVAADSPVYLSLRMDGRVRGSGIGCPPWNALVAQLPPVKGIWSGLLDGMDGRV